MYNTRNGEGVRQDRLVLDTSCTTTGNGVGIVLSEDLKDRVLAVERPSDRVTRMKLEIEGEVWNIISCYAPQTGCTEYEKDQFWETIEHKSPFQCDPLHK